MGFLPTAAGGLIGANAAAQVHLHALAVASFGIGVICWVMLGSVIMNRLFTHPSLPNALVPTIAIELGIPAVAGLAYFAVAGRTMSFVACALGGYAVLMALAQVRLIPVYRRLSFTPGAWSFAFAYAAAAADALVGLAIKKPPASAGYAIAVIALLTAFVSWIVSARWSSPSAGSSFPPGYPRADARNSSTGAADIAGPSNPGTDCLLTCLSIRRSQTHFQRCWLRFRVPRPVLLQAYWRSFQIIAVRSKLPVTSHLPFGENTTASTKLLCPLRGAANCGWAASATLHNAAVWVRAPIAKVRPAGENARACTQALAGVKTDSRIGRVGRVTSQMITVWSVLPLARMCPSGENATADAMSVWPVRVWLCVGTAGLVTSHKMTVRS